MEFKNHQALKDVLREQLEQKGLTIEKLAEHTGIAERHLIALFHGNLERLPAAPYVRGYLTKVGTALNLNGQELWKLFSHELNLKTSGPQDRLPVNRYALKKVNRRWIITGGVIAIVLIYVAVNGNRLLGRPELVITNPTADTTTVSTESITLAGWLNARDTLTIDEEEVPLTPDGTFERRYPLVPGLNTITFVAKRLLGREMRIIRQIVYQPETLLSPGEPAPEHK